MASKNKNKADSKNFAAKNTMNPPADQGAPKPGPQQPETLERQVGQYTGRGVPSVEKK